MKEIYIGLDLGATWVRGICGYKNGSIIKKIKRRTPKEKDIVENTMIDIVRELLDDSDGKLLGIGVGSIGPLDLQKGEVVNTPNLPVKRIKVKEALQDTFKVPVYLVNDCSAAVVGEKIFGAGKQFNNIFYVTISTGLGGGAIVDGHLLFGKDGNAPEIGHIIVDTDFKLKCGCGKYGHWEAYASGSNLPNYARLIINQEKDKSFHDSVLFSLTEGDLNNLESKIIFKAANMGDALALKIVEAIGKINAIGFAEIINVFDPELITVGGSVILKNKELTMPYIIKNVEKYTINRIPEIITTPLEEDVVLLGAFALALHPEFIPEKFR